MNRSEMLARALHRPEPWDLIVIGGGATGAGVAVDAAARGYDVLLLERADFGSGTSSRSTKLAHGGVRYLQQGHLGLVFESLRERERLLHNAPHLVRDRAFVLPCYSRWERAYYGLGLKAYGLLAGRSAFGRSEILSRAETVRLLPTVRTDGLRGGVLYHDGQFDDSRLLVHLILTAVDQGAAVLNYVEAIGFLRGANGITGVQARDQESGAEFNISARIVINAAGPFCDSLRQLLDPATEPMLAVSQGSHLVFDRSFLPGSAALLVPKTSDGRVLFAIPWQGHVLVGTTDVAVKAASTQPRPMAAEIDFILETAGRYLARRPWREDILSQFAGLRPLVKAGGKSTAALSRDFTIRDDQAGLLTITGGKWTTYRRMAEACVNRAAELAGLPPHPCPTAQLSLHGYHTSAETFGSLSEYGSDAPALLKLRESEPKLAVPLHSALPYTGAEVVWAARAEMARTIEDVLARRTRALFLNARAAVEMAPRVGELLARELGRDEKWATEQVRAFRELGRGWYETV